MHLEALGGLGAPAWLSGIFLPWLLGLREMWMLPTYPYLSLLPKISWSHSIRITTPVLPAEWPVGLKTGMRQKRAAEEP